MSVRFHFNFDGEVNMAFEQAYQTAAREIPSASALSRQVHGLFALDNFQSSCKSAADTIRKEPARLETQHELLAPAVFRSLGALSTAYILDDRPLTGELMRNRLRISSEAVSQFNRDSFTAQPFKNVEFANPTIRPALERLTNPEFRATPEIRAAAPPLFRNGIAPLIAAQAAELAVDWLLPRNAISSKTLLADFLMPSAAMALNLSTLGRWAPLARVGLMVGAHTVFHLTFDQQVEKK
jgi:hypothetical protein